jgi:hypothetical protein
MVRTIWTAAGRLAVVTAVLWATCSVAFAQTPRLEVRVSNTIVAIPGSLPAWGGDITVYLTNQADSIAAFTLWLQLDRPDIITFVAADSIHFQYDLSGSAVAAWGSANVRSVSGMPYDVRIDASANMVPSNYLAPADTARVLIKLPFTILPAAQTDPDPMANVLVSTSPHFFSFVRPDGSVIGLVMNPGPVLDTNVVSVKDGSVKIAGCVADFDVSIDGIPLSVADGIQLFKILRGAVPPPVELYHADLNGDCVVDIADSVLFMCVFEHGLSCLPDYPRVTCCTPSFTPCCVGRTGNVDCDPEGRVDISDLSAMIDHLYISLAPPCCYSAMNIDGDPQFGLDISDLSALIDYLYMSFTLPAACPW